MIPASLTLAFLFFLAPFLIFCLGFMQTAPGAAAVVLALAASLPMLRATDWRGRPDWPVFAGAAAISLLLTLLSGIGHVFYQTDDWVVRDALLYDLVRHPWPVAYNVDGVPGLIRAPLGMYMLPAAIGKIGGMGLAQAALFAQNAAVVALCMYLFARSLPAGRSRWVMLVLFVAFSGLDCVPWLRRWLDGLPELALPHIEPWPIHFQYSSNVTEIFWTPHHGLAGWTLVAAYLVWRAGKISALGIAPLWATSIFWSPLAAIGAAPFLAFAFFCDIKDGKLRLPELAAAAAIGATAIPIAIFLGRDTANIEKGFQDFTNLEVLRSYFAMMALEVAPLLAIAARGRDPKDQRGTIEFWLMGALLFVIPVYTLGFANDWAMRVSIPALTLLCVRCVPGLMSLGAEPVPRRAIMVGIVAFGAITPAVEIWRNITVPATPLSACNVVESLKDGPYAGSPIDYYVASKSSFAPFSSLFRQPSNEPLGWNTKKCWPGRKFINAPAERKP